MPNRQNRRNYYRVLQVQPDAPGEIIKASYRTLMQKLRHHPDLGGDEWNASLINQAYTVLSDRRKRAEYDREQADLRRRVGERARREERVDEAAAPAGPPAAAEYTGKRCPLCNAPIQAASVYGPSSEVCSRCHSPLTPVSLLESRHPGRVAQRIEHSAEMSFITAWPPTARYHARIVDLSPTGMRFRCAKRLQREDRIRIESPTLVAIAVVSRCHPERSGRTFTTGVAFLTLELARSTGTFLSESV